MRNGRFVELPCPVAFTAINDNMFYVCEPTNLYLLTRHVKSAVDWYINESILRGVGGWGYTCTYTVCLRSLRKLINYSARKRNFLIIILGGLSELTSK